MSRTINMHFFSIMRMGVRLAFVFGLTGLLSVVIVVMTVTQCMGFVERIEETLKKPQRNGSVAALCVTALKMCIAFLICGAMTWWIARQVPFG